MYSKTQWKDHIVERQRTYTAVTNPDGSITLTPAPGEITQQGTPMSASNFNHMENGIADAHDAIDTLEGDVEDLEESKFDAAKIIYSENEPDVVEGAIWLKPV